MENKSLGRKKDHICSETTINLMKSNFSNYFRIGNKDFEINFEYKNDDDFTVLKFDGKNIFFRKNLNGINLKKVKLIGKMSDYKRNYEKVILLFSMFFKNVDLVLMVNGDFSRDIGINNFNSLNKRNKPTFKINKCCLKISGKNQIFKNNSIGIHSSNVYSVKLCSNDEDDIIDDTFHYYNKFIFKDIFNIKIDHTKRIPDLKKDLDLINMLLL